VLRDLMGSCNAWPLLEGGSDDAIVDAVAIR
jgi:hypothetical protein